MSASPVIFALDFPSVGEARAMAARVAPAIGMVKVGLELFIAGGHEAVAIGAAVDRPVFLDLKLHDIPETVERAVAQACALGVKMLTVHASGGPVMLRRAVERADKERSGLAITAVTVLTSLDAGELHRMGVAADPEAHARRLARMAFDEGVRAFVCSPHEVKALRGELGGEVTLVTPGVRARAAGDDQKRVMTAHDAIVAGANWLVVGRPIRDAADPRVAAEAIAREAAGASA